MRKPLLLCLLLFAILSRSALATYSIVACDPQTQQCGVAVQTNNLAVGASVPYAQARVGAIASQFETNPRYGPSGLALLAQGKSPEETLKQLLLEDGNFDGEGIEARQLGIVALDGRSTFYTGKEAADAYWAGGRKGHGYSIQGNRLSSAQVVDAMEKAFLKTSGPLAERLIAALIAGDAAGGQKTGRESAALLVRTPEGFPLDIDLRVDHANDPVHELQKLYNMQEARQQLINAAHAARNNQFVLAKSLIINAVARAPEWQRIWLLAAKTAEDIEEPQLALQYVNVTFSQNPAWVQQEIGSGNYAEIGASPLFHRWITLDQEEHALSAYHNFATEKQTAVKDRNRVIRMLLEVGHSREALGLLGNADLTDVDSQLLRAEAYAASGDYSHAIEQCKKAETLTKDNLRVRLRLDQLLKDSDASQKNQ